jgi:hypothetical protein
MDRYLLYVDKLLEDDWGVFSFIAFFLSSQYVHDMFGIINVNDLSLSSFLAEGFYFTAQNLKYIGMI